MMWTPLRSPKMYGFILRVPAVGLVAEVRSGLEQLLHGDDSGRHRSFSFRLCLGGAE